MYHNSETNFDESALLQRAEELETMLQDTSISEQDKQTALLDFLNVLRTERAAKIGVDFSERLMERIHTAFNTHPTTELAVDLLYACLLVQQFHSMNFDHWRADHAIKKCSTALTALEMDGKYSDCFRFCQETADTYAEARFWPEALKYAIRAHQLVKKLLAEDISLLENGEMLDPHDTASLICEYALHTKDGVTEKMTIMLTADLGEDDFREIVDEAQENMEEMVVDEVEYSDEYLAIRYELEEKIDEALDHQRGYYDYCKDYWIAKKLILRTEYGIQWQSPATLNPNTEFH